MLGSVTLDLREAVLPGTDVEIEARSILGSVTVAVPAGVEGDVIGGGVRQRLTEEIKTQMRRYL